jgi:hypothetical protein
VCSSDLARRREVAAIANGAGTTLSLTDAIVRGTEPRAGGIAGHGLVAQAGARLDGTRTIVADNRDIGVLAVGAGTAVTLVDVVARSTQPRSDGSSGLGLTVHAGARLELRNALVADNRAIGVLGAGDRTTVALTDAVVRGTQPQPDGSFGDGIAISGGARLDAVRVLVAGNREFGVHATGAASVLTLTDSAVVATGANGRGNFGCAAEGSERATLSATRVLFADSREGGLLVFGGNTTATLTDVLITDVAPSARGFGTGAMAFDGARIALDRVALTGVHGVGIAAVPLADTLSDPNANSRIMGLDVFVRDVRSSTIRFNDGARTEATPWQLVAYGLHVGGGCLLDVARAVVAAGGFGFFAARDGALTVRTGVVAGQLDAFGASDTAPGALVLEGVAQHGNAVADVMRDVGLPEAAGLPRPTPPPCVDVACP